MSSLYEFFVHIASNYGTASAVLFLVILAVLTGMYLIVKTFPDIIRAYIEKKATESKDSHKRGTIKRKNVSPEVTKVLSNLILETNSDRALLLEFSNGTSNLAGLPFLFVSATSESLSLGTASVAQSYQRINVSLFANFLLDLEDKSYIIINDIEEIQNEYPYIYFLLKASNVKSAVFYSIYGVDEELGFIILESSQKNTLNRDETLSEIMESAQKISSLLNFEGIEDMIM